MEITALLLAVVNSNIDPKTIQNAKAHLEWDSGYGSIIAVELELKTMRNNAPDFARIKMNYQISEYFETVSKLLLDPGLLQPLLEYIRIDKQLATIDAGRPKPDFDEITYGGHKH